MAITHCVCIYPQFHLVRYHSFVHDPFAWSSSIQFHLFLIYYEVSFVGLSFIPSHYMFMYFLRASFGPNPILMAPQLPLVPFMVISSNHCQLLFVSLMVVYVSINPSSKSHSTYISPLFIAHLCHDGLSISLWFIQILPFNSLHNTFKVLGFLSLTLVSLDYYTIHFISISPCFYIIHFISISSFPSNTFNSFPYIQ